MSASVPPDPPPRRPSGDHRPLIARMVAGVRDAMRRTGSATVRLTPSALLAALCAGAYAPVIAAATGAGAVGTAAVGVLGGVGGNVLSKAIVRAIERLRSAGPGDGAAPEAVEAVEAALREELAVALDGGGAEAEELRLEIVGTLRRLSVGEEELAGLVAGVSTDVRGARALIAEGFARQDIRLTGFEALLQGILASAAATGDAVDAARAEGREGRRAQDRRFDTVVDLLHEVLLWVRGGPGGAASASPGEPPYMGLAPFRTGQERYFFGRERLTRELLARPELSSGGNGNAGGLLVVTGASGAGKTSLLQAGLVPGFGGGPLLVATPGTDPFGALGLELANLLGTDAVTLTDSLRRPGGLGVLLRQAARRHAADPDTRTLLVVDQFEELFTQTGDEAEREAFVAAIAGAATDRAAYVVLGLRGDFFDRCAEYAELRPALGGAFIVGPMTRDELRQAIERPAARAGLAFEDAGLPGAILDDVHGPGAGALHRSAVLPLLSQTMLTLWGDRSGATLTRSAYERTGGVSRAVAERAEEVYGGLDADGRAAAKAVFRQLVGVTGERAHRRRVRLSALDAADPVTSRVLNAFVGARLLVVDERARAAIAHDSLLGFWPRLEEWVSEERASLTAYQRLGDDAAGWAAKERNPSFLYQGTRLAETEREYEREWSARPDRYPAPGAEVAEFLRASRRHEDRRVRTRRGAVSLLAVLLVAALVTTVLTVNANARLTEQRDREVSLRLAGASRDAADTDGALARLLAAAAWETSETDEAWDAMTNAVDRPATGLLPDPNRAKPTAAAFSADGAWIATGTQDGGLAILGTRTWTALTLPSRLGAAVTSIAVSGDGSLVAAGTDAEVTVWDIGTGATRAFQPFPDSDQTPALAFNGDRTVLATGRYDLPGDGRTHESVRLWDAATLAAVSGMSTEWGVTSLAFDDARGVLAVGDLSGLVSERETSTGEELRRDGEPTGSAAGSVAWSPAGAAVTAVCTSGCVLTDTAAGTTAELAAEAHAAAFSGDGRLLAVAQGGGVDVWRTDGPVYLGTLPHEDVLHAVGFVPGTSTIAAAGEEGVHLWDLAARLPMRSLDSADSDRVFLYQAGWTADGGGIIATGSFGAQVWSTADGTVVKQVPTEEALTTAVSPQGIVAGQPHASPGTVVVTDLADPIARRSIEVFASADPALDITQVMTLDEDGGILATWFSNPDAQEVAGGVAVGLWDTGTGTLLRSLPGTEHGGLSAIRFSADGSSLVTADRRGLVQVWRTSDGVRTGTFQSDDPTVFAVEPNRDGSLVAIGTSSGVTLWNPVTWATTNVAPFDAGVVDADFSPDGRHLLLSPLVEAEPVIWDVRTNTPAAVIPGGFDAWHSSFSPDGSSLLLKRPNTSRESYVTADVSFLRDPHAAVCAQTTRALTDNEWAAYLPDVPRDSLHICGR